MYEGWYSTHLRTTGIALNNAERKDQSRNEKEITEMRADVLQFL